MAANTYLEGSYSEIHPDITGDAGGIENLLQQLEFRATLRPPFEASALDARPSTRWLRTRKDKALHEGLLCRHGFVQVD